MSDYQIVFFDLDTTGLDIAWCHIIQLSAIIGDNMFDRCIFPKRRINKRATEVNGYTKSPDCLYRNGYPVQTTPLREAFTSFIEFLESFGCPVLLAAHNARLFDAPVLTRVLRKLSLMQEFEQVVFGFLDTLVLSRNLFPGLNSHSLQPHLTNKVQNADDKAWALQELFNRWRPDIQSVRKATCGLWCIKKNYRRKKVKNNRATKRKSNIQK